jgi:anaerobic magnesium-protoporphyrin IX monomethyl ester cyclase
MKVLLISTPTRTDQPNMMPPIGLLYLASSLRNAGNTVELIDIARTRQENTETIEQIGKIKPGLIAISGIITAYKFIHALVRDIKKNYPDIPVVVGGHVVLDNLELMLKSVGCDYCILGYGELKIISLVEYLEGHCEITSIPKLAYLNNGEIVENEGDLFYPTLDEVPLPAYDLIDMNHYAVVRNDQIFEYLEKTGKPAPPYNRYFFVVGSRGCTDKCVFCVHDLYFRKFYTHSTKYIIENVKKLYDEYNIRIFGFDTDMFLYNVKQTRELVDAMNEYFPDAYFSCSTRSNVVSPELIGILKNSNCFMLSYGFESGSDKTLKFLNKRTTRDMNISAYKQIVNADIVASISFIVGNPVDDAITIADTKKAIEEAEITEAGVFFLTPYPGSKLFHWAVKEGKIPHIEEYLFHVSNRNASEFNINLTKYPDIIVRMMYVMVQNSLKDNTNYFFKRYLLPIIFNLYFTLRGNRHDRELSL